MYFTLNVVRDAASDDTPHATHFTPLFLKTKEADRFGTW
jgi:hypothetical protein